MKPIKFFSILFVLTYGMSELRSQNISDIEVIFKKASHQNPWLVKEPIRKITPGIRVGKNSYFTITIPNEKPLFAELERSNHSNSKLKVERYDSSIGFIHLTSDEVFALPIVKVDSPTAQKICNYKSSDYITFSFSYVPLLAYRSDTYVDQAQFIIRNGFLCGFQIQNSIIPTFYMEKFLNDKNPFEVPHPGFQFVSALTNSELEFYFPSKSKGIVVSQVYPGVGPAFQLFPGDAITAINGQELNRFDRIEMGNKALDLILRSGSKLKAIGDKVSLHILRNGKPLIINYYLQKYSEEEFLVPETHPADTPYYYISGGLFFTELTGNYLKEFGENYRKNSEKKLLYLSESYFSKVHPHRERIVLLSRVLPDERNLGYQEFQDLIVQKVNGSNIFNLKELKKAIQANKNEYLTIELSGGKIIILRTDTIREIDTNILNNYKLKYLDNLGL
ncbi:MAG: PDZ domain-containing protein [Leptospiraceae bacterium]|nr:PDZ domain-containing protein [Leptospiraceae bacterium]MCZ8347572.1 PDZ domain-containing protein [Leptospiraceae bacterium]PJE03883.1 MAG: serine protease [Leptospira sp.]